MRQKVNSGVYQPEELSWSYGSLLKHSCDLTFSLSSLSPVAARPRSLPSTSLLRFPLPSFLLSVIIASSLFTSPLFCLFRDVLSNSNRLNVLCKKAVICHKLSSITHFFICRLIISPSLHQSVRSATTNLFFGSCFHQICDCGLSVSVLCIHKSSCYLFYCALLFLSVLTRVLVSFQVLHYFFFQACAAPVNTCVTCW